MSLDTATALLRRMKWDGEVVCSRFFENAAECLQEAGLPADAVLSARPDAAVDTLLRGSLGDDDVMCTSCLEDKAGPDTVGLRCGHMFCSECWSNHLTAAVGRGPVCVSDTRCLEAPSCTQVVTNAVWEALAKPATLETYNRCDRCRLKQQTCLLHPCLCLLVLACLLACVAAWYCCCCRCRCSVWHCA